MNTIYEDLISLSKEFNIPIITAIQADRGSGKNSTGLDQIYNSVYFFLVDYISSFKEVHLENVRIFVR